MTRYSTFRPAYCAGEFIRLPPYGRAKRAPFNGLPARDPYGQRNYLFRMTQVQSRMTFACGAAMSAIR